MRCRNAWNQINPLKTRLLQFAKMLRDNFKRLFLLWLVGTTAAASVSCASPPPPPIAPTKSTLPQAPPPPPPAVCKLAEGLPPLQSPNLDSSASLSEKNLSTLVHTLADPALRGRSAGSVENKRVAELLGKTFLSFGLKPLAGKEPCIVFELNGIQDQNVVATLPAPKHRENAKGILIGAHYDAQGEVNGEVYPGADDNASGVAVLLEIARLLSLREHTISFTFVAFGAEEEGILGSRAFVAAEQEWTRELRLMMNLDMVGRPFLDGSALRMLVPRASEALGFVVGERKKKETDALLHRAAQKEDCPIYGIPEIAMKKLGYYSDSVPFGSMSPTIFLSDAALLDYHSPGDTRDKIDPETMLRAARLVLAIVQEIENENEIEAEEQAPAGAP